ncbi:hypothetical protein D3C73_265780 [compost metagenome]
MNNFEVLDFTAFHILTNGLACNRNTISVESTRLLEKLMNYGTYAAGTMNVFNEVVGCRCELGDMRYTVSHFVNTFKRIINACFLSESQGMQYSIGGTTHSHIESKCIIDRFHGNNVTRLEIKLDQLHQLLGGFSYEITAIFGDRKDRTVTRKCNAKCFGKAVHGVRCEHP